MKTRLTVALIAFSIGNCFASDKAQSTLIKITPKRIPMTKIAQIACAPPGQQYGIHLSAEADVYLNQTALDYRRKNPKSFAYPVGSKFVKRKFAKKGDKEPELETVMVWAKNAGKVDDWIFSMLSLPDRVPLNQSRKVSCASCHKRYRDRGFISFETEVALQKHLKATKP